MLDLTPARFDVSITRFTVNNESIRIKLINVNEENLQYIDDIHLILNKKQYEGLKINGDKETCIIEIIDKESWSIEKLAELFYNELTDKGLNVSYKSKDFKL